MCLHTMKMEGYIKLPLIMTMVAWIVSNGGSLCNKVHSLTTYNDNSFAFSDTGDSCIKAYNPSEKSNVLL